MVGTVAKETIPHLRGPLLLNLRGRQPLERVNHLTDLPKVQEI